MDTRKTDTSLRWTLSHVLPERRQISHRRTSTRRKTLDRHLYKDGHLLLSQRNILIAYAVFFHEFFSVTRDWYPPDAINRKDLFDHTQSL